MALKTRADFRPPVTELRSRQTQGTGEDLAAQQAAQTMAEAMARALQETMDRISAIQQREGVPTLAPTDGSRAPYAGLPTVSGLDIQRLASMPLQQSLAPQAPLERPDLSQAKVFGRPVETSSSHDLFWHYFGDRKAPHTNEEARAMMAEMQQKFAPFGFKVEPIEHERMDKVRITGPDGRVEEVDFIYAMGGAQGEQRLQWLSHNPVGPGAKGGALDEGFVMSILSEFEPTNAGIMKALEKIRQRPGYEDSEVLQHPERLDKIRFPNGKVVDVIIGAGGPNPRWGWLPE